MAFEYSDDPKWKKEKKHVYEITGNCFVYVLEDEDVWSVFNTDMPDLEPIEYEHSDDCWCFDDEETE